MPPLRAGRCVVAALAGSLVAAPPAGAHVHTNFNLIPRHGALLGAFVNTRSDMWAGVQGLQQTLGFKLTIVHHYKPWRITSYKVDRTAMRHRQIPMISWSPGGTTTAAAIASGSQDALIKRTAHDIKSLRKRIFLRLAYEMDQPPGHRRYIGQPAEFIRAWRRIYRIFQRVGAVNARFVWCAIAANFKTGHAQAYYPGNRYVNWIAADGYNWYPAKSEWAGYRKIFTPFYRWATGHRRPLMIAETGSMEDPHRAGRKARWIRSSRRWVRAHHHIRAVVYFDSISPKGYDFRLGTSSSALHAFLRWGRGTYWNMMR